jgi:hypothetical protein
MMKNHFMHEKYGIVEIDDEYIYLEYNDKINTRGTLGIQLKFCVQDDPNKEFTKELMEEFIYSTFRHTYDANGGRFGIDRVQNNVEKPPIYDLFKFDMDVIVLDTPENIKYEVRTV